MAIHWDKHIYGDYEINDLISNIDFAPTLFYMANIDAYPEIAGKSFLELLLNSYSEKGKLFRESLFYDWERVTSARPNNFGYPIRTIITNRHQFVRNMKPGCRCPAGNRLNESEAAKAVMFTKKNQ